MCSHRKSLCSSAPSRMSDNIQPLRLPTPPQPICMLKRAGSSRNSSNDAPEAISLHQLTVSSPEGERDTRFQNYPCRVHAAFGEPAVGSIRTVTPIGPPSTSSQSATATSSSIRCQPYPYCLSKLSAKLFPTPVIINHFYCLADLSQELQDLVEFRQTSDGRGQGVFAKYCLPLPERSKVLQDVRKWVDDNSMKARSIDDDTQRTDTTDFGLANMPSRRRTESLCFPFDHDDPDVHNINSPPPSSNTSSLLTPWQNMSTTQGSPLPQPCSLSRCTPVSSRRMSILQNTSDNEDDEQYVGIFSGRAVPFEEDDAQSYDYVKASLTTDELTYALTVGNNIVIGGRTRLDWAGVMNHSHQHPNIEIDDQGRLRQIYPIRAGEELKWDYGHAYWFDRIVSSEEDAFKQMSATQILMWQRIFRTTENFAPFLDHSFQIRLQSMPLDQRLQLLFERHDAIVHGYTPNSR